MKRVLFPAVLFVLCLCLLAGCSCEHEWQAADCTTPKTCTKCQEVEGEALGHSWQDATCTQPRSCALCALTEGEVLPHSWVEVSCAAPRHCSVCALTEGEALEHTWQEANYQRAKSCTVCGAEEGQPLTAEYEQGGLVCDMEVGKEYPYFTYAGQNVNLTVTARVKITDFRIFDSDATHPAKEGYEWRCVQSELVFDPENAEQYGMRFSRWIEDYYDVDDWRKTICLLDNGDMTYTINYMGQPTEIYCVVENYYWTGWVDGANTYYETIYFQVPVGYDGVVIGYIDPRTMNSGDTHETTPVTEVADESSMFFRLA